MPSAFYFERKKNIQALSYTLIVCGGVLFFLFFYKWKFSPALPLPQDEGIEVNLGNSEEGFGEVAPQVAGNASNANQLLSSSASNNAAENIIQSSPNEEGDIALPISKKIPIKQITASSTIQSTTKHQSQSNQITSQPTQPQPKALYKGSVAGAGGNEAAKTNNVYNQGIAGGKGDQGNPNGNPNSNSYTGNGGTGKSGVSIRSGLQGRHFLRLPSFEDEFNKNARVAVDISVDKDGKVTWASVNLKSTTTTDIQIKNIAIEKAKQLKLNKGNIALQSGTIIFDFKLHE